MQGQTSKLFLVQIFHLLKLNKIINNKSDLKEDQKENVQMMYHMETASSKLRRAPFNLIDSNKEKAQLAKDLIIK
jgi:hypothetical protein